MQGKTVIPKTVKMLFLKQLIYVIVYKQLHGRKQTSQNKTEINGIGKILS